MSPKSKFEGYDLDNPIVLGNSMILLKNECRTLHVDKNFNILPSQPFTGVDMEAIGRRCRIRRVYKDGKVGYANKDWKVFIPIQFDTAFPFKNGKAKVQKDNFSFEINIKGKIIGKKIFMNGED